MNNLSIFSVAKFSTVLSLSVKCECRCHFLTLHYLSIQVAPLKSKWVEKTRRVWANEGRKSEKLDHSNMIINEIGCDFDGLLVPIKWILWWDVTLNIKCPDVLSTNIGLVQLILP